MPRKKQQISNWTGLSLEMWQGELANRRFGAKLGADPRVQQMLSVITNTRPQTHPDRHISITKEDALIELGRRVGYDNCLGVLLVMLSGARLDQKPQEVELPTYVQEEEGD